MNLNTNNYSATINYLYGLQKHGIKLGLDNINRLMNILGQPQKLFRSVHVAGTNGKGSTSAAIAAILVECGFKVGLFSSPHLVSFTERIRINNRQILESEVIDLAAEIRRSIAATDLNPTFFEFVTAMAFHYFASNHVDWAIVETGMGGRLDATNVIHPDTSIITNISLDHSEFLGSKISDITVEKAGIIKTGVPVITASIISDIVMQLRDIARRCGSEFHAYDRDFSGKLLGMDDRHIIFNYAGYREFNNLSASLPGKYQLFNACTAIRACELLRQKGFSITDNAISSGLSKVRLEGRLERVSEIPPVILDGAHNPEAARSLAGTITELFPDKKIILIAGIMDDKDIRGILYPLVQIAESLILTKPDYERASPPEKLREIVLNMETEGTNYHPSSIHVSKTVGDALNLAKSICRKDNIILVTGSFYTTGEVKEILGNPAVLSRLREL